MGALPSDWGTPVVTPINEAWFTSGSLALQRCVSCANVQHPPEEVCRACGAMDFDVEVVAPMGTVHSFTIVHYAANAALADAVPYAVVLVALDELPEVRVVGNVLDVAPADVTIGLPVHAVDRKSVV